MDLDQFLNWLEGTPIAVAIRENEVLFPWIESLHVLPIALVVGTISIVDLRLIGLASRNRAVTVLMREVLPYTWIAFGVAVITGLLLFSSNAPKYAHNFYFQAKMALLVLAGCNMAAFHRIGTREIVHWDAAGRTLGRGQDRGWHLAPGLDRGGGVRPLDRLHVALVRPPGYFLVTARISIARRATYAIPTASDVCCARLDGDG